MKDAYYGRAVPAIFQTFPALQVWRIKYVVSPYLALYNLLKRLRPQRETSLTLWKKADLDLRLSNNDAQKNQPPLHIDLQEKKTKFSPKTDETSKKTHDGNDGKPNDSSSQLPLSNFPSPNPTVPRLTIPYELEGQLNLVILGFGKYQMIKEMVSWYPFARTLTIEMEHKYKKKVLHSYTLFIFPRYYKIFHYWLCWRYQKLIKSYAANKIRIKEKQKIEELAFAAGLENSEEVFERPLTGPVPLPVNAVDDDGEILTLEERHQIETSREIAYKKYRQVLLDTKQSWKFAEELYGNIFITYTNRRAFIDKFKLADARRAYAIIMDRHGKLFWIEDETCTISRANSAFDRLKLDHLIVDRNLLPRYRSDMTYLYSKQEECALRPEKHDKFPNNIEDNKKNLKRLNH